MTTLSIIPSTNAFFSSKWGDSSSVCALLVFGRLLEVFCLKFFLFFALSSCFFFRFDAAGKSFLLHSSFFLRLLMVPDDLGASSPNSAL
ncbi:MAG: hypothetical protein V7689_10815, partial [Psychrobacter sp.]